MNRPETKTIPHDQTRRTPRTLVRLIERDILGERFRLDAFAERINSVCRKFYTVEDDGLRQPWISATFGNPPFEISKLAIAKAAQEANERGIVSCLIAPAGCSQKWFHEYAAQGTIYLPTKRMKFLKSITGEPTREAMMDTAVYLFGGRFRNPRPDRGYRVFRLEVTRETFES